MVFHFHFFIVRELNQTVMHQIPFNSMRCRFLNPAHTGLTGAYETNRPVVKIYTQQIQRKKHRLSFVPSPLWLG